MRTPMAIAGSAIFLVLAPGVVAGFVPWLLTEWHRLPLAPILIFRAAGALLILAGSVLLLDAFARFALQGSGTPAPVAPTDRLVIGGAYRFVRNPMYLAVLAIILGQALLFGRAVLLLYAAAFTAAVLAFVRGYEEPTLSRRYGAEYEAYRRAVPAWLPRLRPWRSE
jgi:protein-S-isoprenylcysteine O-methyltransferase Ste14